MKYLIINKDNSKLINVGDEAAHVRPGGAAVSAKKPCLFCSWSSFLNFCQVKPVSPLQKVRRYLCNGAPDSNHDPTGVRNSLSLQKKFWLKTHFSTKCIGKENTTAILCNSTTAIVMLSNYFALILHGYLNPQVPILPLVFIYWVCQITNAII